MITDPGDPSPEEIEEHYLSNHLPFRAWCKCCVLAKAKDSPHKRIEHGKDKDGVPIVGLDFCHPGEDDDGADKMDILVVKDSPSKALFSHACNSKAVDERVAAKVVEDIESLGRKKIILRSDNDKSIKALRKVISDTRIEETLQQDTPTYSSQSNGSTERGVQSVQGQIRVTKIALEQRLQKEVRSGRS